MQDRIKLQCEQCASVNYVDDNAENLGFEAFTCWSCGMNTFLPDNGLYRFMDRTCVEEDEAITLIDTYRIIDIAGHKNG